MFDKNNPKKNYPAITHACVNDAARSIKKGLSIDLVNAQIFWLFSADTWEAHMNFPASNGYCYVVHNH